MQKKIAKKLFTTFFLITVACSAAKDPYLLSHLPRIQILEKQDHKFCASLKLNFDRSDNLKNELYWRCRLSLAKYKLFTNPASSNEAKHNLEIGDLVTKISLKLSVTPESTLMQENRKIDNFQHQQCLVMGFEIETEDQTKIDDYFACRKALIEDQQLVPPFGDAAYLNYPNRSYNLGFAIDQRIDAAIKRYNAAKKKYPTCVKFNLNNVNFKNCAMAQDKSYQCLATIDKKIFKQDAEEKMTCQKQSYVRFPSELLKEEERSKAEIERMKSNSDYYNQHNFASLGIDYSQFDADAERAQKELAEKQKKTDKNVNSKNGLYSHYELTRLRQKYIFSCQKEAEKRTEEFARGLKKDCEELVEFKIVGEE